MGAPSTIRKRLDLRVDDLENQTADVLADVYWKIGQAGHDVERIVKILASLQRIEHIQRRLWALDRQLERLAAWYEYHEMPWWRRVFHHAPPVP